MISYMILAGVVVLTVIGDYALKHASMTASPVTSYWFASGVSLYAVTALGWLLLMRSHNLGQIAILYSAATILALTGAGVVFFGENVSSKQAAGLTAALLSVFLTSSEA